ncbi:MAG TPA: nucleotidyl transferase AbiEii/AbiGii toxin family protein [Thermoplasmata archaeon]|nr:nucleotidyl transferase AbiEii/AbiGii toxin family protein [Thermoplasmata archaeon]
MKAFIEEVGNLLKIPRRDLIEKDIILHKLLLSLHENDSFCNNFLFKGGTCLIKSYLDYYRFSEDIDFTWYNQSVFEKKSQKEIREYLSDIIDEVGDIFESINEETDFVCDKSDRKYVELGGSNKTATFKLWYDSKILKYTTFVKVQINFVEKIIYPPSIRELDSLLSGYGCKELKSLFPNEYKEYCKKIFFPTYDIKEILCEKVRAILTRRGIKARDFVDIYLISKVFDIDVAEIRSQIIDKTTFILTMYEKYRKNLEEKIYLLDSGDVFEWGREKNLLLQEINETEFYNFMETFTGTLKDIAMDIHQKHHL